METFIFSTFAPIITEFEEGRQWIKDELIFTKTKDVNLFEVTIRVLGALLTNYHFTKDEMFLNKAVSIFYLFYSILVDSRDFFRVNWLYRMIDSKSIL